MTDTIKDIIPINNDVIFQFDQDSRKVRSGKQTSQAFQEVTNWGFEFHNFDETTKQPRWGYITAIGPKVSSELEVGMHILVDALKWTTHVTYGKEKFWKTNDAHILAYEIETNSAEDA